MATTKSIEHSIKGQRLVQAKVLEPLFNHEVPLQMYVGSDLITIAATVGEIFRNCQAEVIKTYGVQAKFVFKGSCVAHLFSSEPFFDIDLHVVMDWTHVPEEEKVSRGYGFRWAILSGIKQLFLQKCTSISEKISRADLDSIVKQDYGVLLAQRGVGPLNIFKVCAAQMEFTAITIVNGKPRAERNFDFNSGALELVFDEESNPFVQTRMGPIDEVIDSVRKKELCCIHPEELIRKSLPRYFAKLLLSGYTDLDRNLLLALISNYQKSFKDLGIEGVFSAALKEIQEHLKEKNSPFEYGLMTLYLLEDEDERVRFFSDKAGAEYRAFSCQKTTHKSFIDALVEQDKKGELCWNLILRATKLKFCLFRNTPCIYVEVPNLCAQRETEKLYFHLPISLLEQSIDLSYQFHYFQRPSCDGSRVEICDDAKRALQDILSKQGRAEKFFPLLQALFYKFDLRRNEKFLDQFLKWLVSVDPSDREFIPAGFFSDITALYEKESFDEKHLGLFFELYDRMLLQSTLSVFDDRYHPLNILEFLCKFIKSPVFKEIHFDTKQRLCLVLSRFIKEFPAFYEKFKQHHFVIKTIINFHHFLYLQGKISVEHFLQGAVLAATHTYDEQALAIVKKGLEKDLKEKKELGLVFNILKQRPTKELLLFIFSNDSLFKENPELLQISKEVLKVFIFEKTPLIKTVDLSQLLSFFNENERESLILDLIQRASCGSQEMQELFDVFLKQIERALLQINIELLDKKSFSFLLSHRSAQTLFDLRPLEVLKKAFKSDEIIYVKKMLSLTESKTLWMDFFEQLDIEACIKKLSLEFFGKTLVELAYFDRDLTHPFLKPATHYFLNHLQAHLKSKKEIPETLLPLIQRLHFALLLKTQHHPIWEEIFTLFDRSLKDKRVETWVDLARVKEGFLHLDHGRLEKTLEPLELSLRFIQGYITAHIDSLKKGAEPREQTLHNTAIFNMLSKSEEVLWTIHNPDLEIDENVAFFAKSYIDHFFSGLSEISEPHIQMLFDALKLCAEFGDQELREYAIENLTRLVANQTPSIKVFMKLSGKPRRLILALLSKALQQVKFDEIEALVYLYRPIYPVRNVITAGAVVHTDLAAYSTPCLDHLLSSTLKFIQLHGHASRLVSENSTALISLNHLFLELTIESLFVIEKVASEIKEDRQAQKHLREKEDLFIRKLSELIDFVGQKKQEHLVVPLKMIGTFSSQLARDKKLQIFYKLLRAATELLRKAQKEKSTALFQKIYPFVHMVYWMFDGFSPRDRESIDQKALQDIVEALIEASIVTPPEDLRLTRNCEIIKMFNTYQTPGNIKSHFLIWMQSIAKKGRAISFDELSLFSQLVMRFHPRVIERFDNRDFKEFMKHKAIDFKDLFKVESHQKDFLSIFHHAFSVHSDKLGLEAQAQGEGETSLLDEETIFRLFILLSQDIRNAIPEMPKSKQLGSIERFYKIIRGCLKQKRSIITPTIISLMNDFFVCLDPSLVLRFRFNSKDNMEETLLTFKDYIETIWQLPQELRTTFALRGIIRLEGLANLMKIHRADLVRFLKEDEIKKLELFFAKPLSPYPELVEPTTSVSLGQQALGLLQGAASSVMSILGTGALSEERRE